MRNGFVKVLIGLFALAAIGGCRSKGIESFVSTTTPQKALGDNEGEWSGDPYAAGSIAEASGGLKTKTNYGAGARSNAPGKLDTGYDQPAKGSGFQPGEYTVESRGGFGHSNGPGLQASPSDVNSLAGRRGQ